MTGELFDVLSGHSVLRASVEPSAPIEQDAFKAGLDRARSHGLAGSLFQTRTRQVLQKKSPESNASFLSGLLIGAELSDLLPTTNILIAGANPLRDLYAQAARHFGLEPAHVFSSDEVRLAVPIAHELILSRFLNS
jgi:2-dehydro-3-deoxygalactonokinase